MHKNGMCSMSVRVTPRLYLPVRPSICRFVCMFVRGNIYDVLHAFPAGGYKLFIHVLSKIEKCMSRFFFTLLLYSLRSGTTLVKAFALRGMYNGKVIISVEGCVFGRNLSYWQF